MKRSSHPHPPRLAIKLFDWYCSSASTDDLRGDMDELFYLDTKRMSITRAKLRYWKHVIQLITSYAIKRRKEKSSVSAFSSNTFNPSMLKNYFLIATRNLARHRFFTIVNVLGLAIGMSICLLFIAMLSFIWRYDNFHVNKDNIYRVIGHTNNPDNNREYASVPMELGDQIEQNMEGVTVVRISRSLDDVIQTANREVELTGYFADPSFLDVFTFPLVKGNATTALRKPNSIVITETAAKKVFGDVDAFGKTITLKNLGECEITGVLKDQPKNSHMRFEVIASYATLAKTEQQHPSKPAIDQWFESRDSYVYLLLKDNHTSDIIETFLQTPSEYYRKNNNFNISFRLQALNDINPGPDLYNQIGPSWDYPSLSIFFVLTLLILIPACFNYANISISRALKRMKEIGLRKVMGGQKEQIFLQFIMETVIITFLALGISYYLFVIVRSEFLSMIVGGRESIDLTTDLPTALCFTAFALFVGFIAGTIPAVYFSKLNPIQALKGKSIGKSGRFSVRKVLTVFQFALSLGFIMSVVIVYNQYRQTINYDFGFQQANILDVDLQGTDPELFRTEFSKLASVQSLSMSSHVPGTGAASSTWIITKEKSDSVEIFQMFVDHQYLRNLELTLLAGEDFQENTSVNTNRVIVNEAFLKEFKIDHPLEAIGQTFLLADHHTVTVAGVVKDFHYLGLREPIRSFFFRYDPKQFAVANLKVTSSDMFGTISQMESAWKIFSDKKFEARFFDDEIEDAYAFYFSMIKICGFLGLLAISISCLGLLGMVVFTTENRIKEIGIRKVMGASTSTVTMLLSKDFAKLMLIAAMIATPLTYLFFDKMYLRLQHYKLPIGISEIVISLFIMIALGLATILSQTLRAARANPVDTLRNE